MERDPAAAWDGMFAFESSSILLMPTAPAVWDINAGSGWGNLLHQRHGVVPETMT